MLILGIQRISRPVVNLLVTRSSQSRCESAEVNYVYTISDFSDVILLIVPSSIDNHLPDWTLTIWLAKSATDSFTSIWTGLLCTPKLHVLYAIMDTCSGRNKGQKLVGHFFEDEIFCRLY